MVFWHIRILFQDKKSGSTTYSYEMDLSEDNVNTFAKQYQEGRTVFFGGRWLDPFNISEVLIYQTEEHSRTYETSEMTGSVSIFSQKKGMPITRNYIFKQPKPQKQKIPQIPSISKNVFIVHGRDSAAVYELASILTELKLNPIILSEQPSGSLTIIEKLEKYSDVGYAFVLLTPDDVGRLSSEKDLRSRPRQNVLLEFGYFIASLGRDRVTCLYKGGVELPSDMHGVAYVQFHKSVKEIYWYIIKELKAVGYSIEL